MVCLSYLSLNEVNKTFPPTLLSHALVPSVLQYNLLCPYTMSQIKPPITLLSPRDKDVTILERYKQSYAMFLLACTGKCGTLVQSNMPIADPSAMARLPTVK